ncbi:iron-containing alcohol dehydrogenase [Aestuariibius sp. 2305UL40-4]|uniref:iron-containing alcohol dehydrogenase n=1 Tax=Aestuariibius violaceus TaxID=3234132 RepID=UPI00345EBF63
MTSPSATWSYPTTIRFGAGRIAELAEACTAAGIARPLLVTDLGLADALITAQALDVLDAAGLGRAVFSGVDGDPDEADLAEGIAAFRDGNHDGVVAFGGGSALDLGKLVAFMADQTRPVWDFEDIGDWWTRADADAIAPIVAVPTTAGTGSEVGRAGVLTNAAQREKKIIFHPRILPAQVICDPELTLGLPPHLTAGTGMDALAHCVEAYCAPGFHPMSHGIALEGIRLIFDALPRAVENGSDILARADMMAAAMMGAVAFQKGLGAVHALAHPLGARFKAHHGTLNAVLLPYALRANRVAVEAPIARAAAYTGIENGFDGFVTEIETLNARIGMPMTLSAMGVAVNELEPVIEAALRDPSAGGNPTPFDAALARTILTAAV